MCINIYSETIVLIDSSDSMHSSWSIIEFIDKDVPNDELDSFSELDTTDAIVTFGVLVIISTDSLKTTEIILSTFLHRFVCF